MRATFFACIRFIRSCVGSLLKGITCNVGNFFHAFVAKKRTASLNICGVSEAVPSISICILTYNRAALLEELLESIAAQGYSDVEVVIGDDASPDDTADVVLRHKKTLHNIVYFRNDPNVGFDRNFLAVAAKASGDFLWFMGDDDKLEPGSLKTVLKSVNTWSDVAGFTLGVLDYSHDFRRVVGVKHLPATVRLQSAAELFEIIVHKLGFLSTMVVNRKMWHSICAGENVLSYANLYIQVYILGRMVQTFGGWVILDEPCVGYRTDNDQFLVDSNWVARLKIDVEAYEQISVGLFGKPSHLHFKINSKILRTHVFSRICNAKLKGCKTVDIAEALKILVANYWRQLSCWLLVIPLLLAPRPILQITQKIYKSYRSNIRGLFTWKQK